MSKKTIERKQVNPAGLGLRQAGRWGLVLLLLFFVPVVGMAFQWPDTGQDKIYDDKGELLGCPEPGHPWYGQDAQYQGERSYTKLDANGDALPDSAASWVMVRDNVTGLVWEVKTDDGSLHDRDNEYYWCDPDPLTNGGHPGLCGNDTNTHDFIDSLNASGFGGRSDWRLPTIKELSTLIHSGKGTGPFIDTAFFPMTRNSFYWSSVPGEPYQEAYSWTVNCKNGTVINMRRNHSGDVHHIRAVSSGP